MGTSNSKDKLVTAINSRLDEQQEEMNNETAAKFAEKKEETKSGSEVQNLIDDDEFINPILARRFTLTQANMMLPIEKQKPIMEKLAEKLNLWAHQGHDCHDPAQDYDSDELDAGDEYMAVKPWLADIKEPTIDPLEINSEPPDVSYDFDFVHGYKSDQIRQNLFYNP